MSQDMTTPVVPETSTAADLETTSSYTVMTTTDDGIQVAYVAMRVSGENVVWSEDLRNSSSQAYREFTGQFLTWFEDVLRRNPDYRGGARVVSLSPGSVVVNSEVMFNQGTNLDVVQEEILTSAVNLSLGVLEVQRISFSEPVTATDGPATESSVITQAPTMDSTAEQTSTQAESTAEQTSTLAPTMESTAEQTSTHTPTMESTAEQTSTHTPTMESTAEQTSTHAPTVGSTAEQTSTHTPTTESTAEQTNTQGPTMESTAEQTSTQALTMASTAEQTSTQGPTMESTAQQTSSHAPTMESTAEQTSTQAESTAEQTSTQGPTIESTAEQTSTQAPTMESTAEQTSTPAPTMESTAEQTSTQAESTAEQTSTQATTKEISTLQTTQEAETTSGETSRPGETTRVTEEPAASSTPEIPDTTVQPTAPSTTVMLTSFRGKVVIISGYDWSDDLLNMDLPDTKDVKNMLETLLGNVFAPLPGYRSVEVVEFSQGSVEVLYDVTFEESSSITPEKLTETMRSYLRNNGNSLGTYVINVDAVEHSGLISHVWKIQKCSRKSTPNQRYVLDEEAEEMHYKRSWTTGSHDNGSSSSRSQSEFAPYDTITTFESNKQPMGDAEVEELPMPLVEAVQPANGGSQGGGANGRNDEEHTYHNVGQGHVNPAFVDPAGYKTYYDYDVSDVTDLAGNGTARRVNGTGRGGNSKRSLVYRNGGTCTFYDLDRDAWETHL
ncbi:lysostaphin [Elysia marginata]|uniref:Lysostaphin n=1 Tax=Elysia marginata TaxID=1093978 RepID=A0AAV4FTN5_9GAST|nr:lysostaphin [Elysia marginata]